MTSNVQTGAAQRGDMVSDQKTTPVSEAAQTDKHGSSQKTIEKSETAAVCGIGYCHPLWLQRCGSITCYSLFYGFAVLMTNALGVYISSQITTIERQFDLSSSQSGIILSCNDIGFILTVLFVSHFGVRFHIPRLLALFTIIYGISGIATSFLRVFAEHDMPTVTNANFTVSKKSNVFLCLADRNSSKLCDNKNNGVGDTSGLDTTVPFVLLCVFMGIQGVGKAPRSSLGTYYIDSNVPDKTKTGFYLGISSTMGLFGPFFAILMGGLFGKIPVDLEETSIQPRDPRWIGAWWLGFLMFGVMAIVAAVPMLFFPNRLNGSEESPAEKVSGEDKSCCTIIKDTPKAIIRILRRPVYTLTISAGAVFFFAFIGGFSFGPKYLENQFNIPTWKANVILGTQNLVTATFGTFIGGYITRRFRFNRQSCIKMVIAVFFVTTAFGSLNFIFGCDNQTIHGMENRTQTDCDCDDVSFMAVCDGNGRTFFSPCHAGCSNKTLSNVFSNCSSTETGTVSTGMCDTDCPYLIPYVAVQVINTFLGTLNVIPIYLIILRSTDEKDRAIAFGMQSFLYALLVFIPAPIVFGHLYDSVCLSWKKTCGSAGACALYDIEQMRYTLISFEFAARIIVLTFYIIIFHVEKREDAQSEKHKVVHKLQKM